MDYFSCVRSWFSAAVILCAGPLSQKKINRFLPSVSSIYRDWKNKDYQSVYDKSRSDSRKKTRRMEPCSHCTVFPLIIFFQARTIRPIAQNYLDASIVSLRNAWYRVFKFPKSPRLPTYLARPTISAVYYYADLAMKYLDYAKKSRLQGRRPSGIPRTCIRSSRRQRKRASRLLPMRLQ